MSDPPPQRPQQLRLRFACRADFTREYRDNMARGGAFVPGATELELREVVSVVLELAFCGEQVQLEAEVVHVVPAGLSAAGGTAGVAIQFQVPAPELREMLGRFACEEAAKAESGPDDECPAFDLARNELPDLFEDPPSPEAYDPTVRDLEPPPASKPDGVPRARREITRVHVRLAVEGRVLEGRTRDISLSGVLVSLDGHGVPVGVCVRLTLRDPVSGAALEVEGTVARHVQGEGTVVALGIHFEVEAGRRSEVERFVDLLWSTDHARRLGGIHGDVAEVGLANLLQTLGQSAPLGTLSVRRGGEEGMIAVEAGQLRYARLGALRGVKALARMLAWHDAGFEFHAHVDALDQEDAPVALEAALLAATRQIDEGGHAGRDLDPEARLRIDRARAEREADELGKTQLAVVELAGAGLTLRRVLDVIPEPDHRVLAAVESLRARGILTLEG